MGDIGELIEEFDDGEIFPDKKDFAPDDIVEINLPNVLSPGCYALCYQGKVVYIGKAKALIVRIYTHYNNMIRVRKGHKPLPGTKPIIFDHIRIFPCALTDLDALERAMINRHRPKFNERLVQPLLGKMTLAQVGFRFEKMGLSKPIAEPRRQIASTPIRRRF